MIKGGGYGIGSALLGRIEWLGCPSVRVTGKKGYRVDVDSADDGLDEALEGEEYKSFLVFLVVQGA